MKVSMVVQRVAERAVNMANFALVRNVAAALSKVETHVLNLETTIRGCSRTRDIHQQRIIRAHIKPPR